MHTDEDSILAIVDQQGWNDATLLALMGEFIYRHPRRTRRFLEYVRRVQREENA